MDVKKATQHTLEITSSFNVFIDGKQTHALLVELTPKRLVILDKLGYHLIIQCENGVPATLYDEADDRNLHTRTGHLQLINHPRHIK